jgi:hypothetical protein
VKKLFVWCFLAMAATLMPTASLAATTTVSTAVEGKLLYSEDGHRLGAVYKVADDGSAELIFNRKLVTIPADTLSDVSGKLTTSLTRREVYDLTQQVQQ